MVEWWRLRGAPAVGENEGNLGPFAGGCGTAAASRFSFVRFGFDAGDAGGFGCLRCLFVPLPVLCDGLVARRSSLASASSSLARLTYSCCCCCCCCSLVSAPADDVVTRFSDASLSPAGVPCPLELGIDGRCISADRTSEVDRSERVAGVRGRETGRVADWGLTGRECGRESETTECTPPSGSAERLAAVGTGVELVLLAQLWLISEWLAESGLSARTDARRPRRVPVSTGATASRSVHRVKCNLCRVMHRSYKADIIHNKSKGV